MEVPSLARIFLMHSCSHLWAGAGASLALCSGRHEGQRLLPLAAHLRL